MLQSLEVCLVAIMLNSDIGDNEDCLYHIVFLQIAQGSEITLAVHFHATSLFISSL